MSETSIILSKNETVRKDDVNKSLNQNWFVFFGQTIDVIIVIIKIGTFEVTSQYYAYFISISSLVFENDKWTFWGLLWAFQYVSCL